MPGGVTTASFKTPVDSTFTYTVVVTDTAGCTLRATVKVAVTPPPVTKVCCDTSVCFGDTVSLTASFIGSGIATYKWMPGGQTTSSIPVSADSTTNYTVIVTDTAGCSQKTTVKVTVKPLPVARACCDTSVCAGVNVTLSASTVGNSIAACKWMPGGQTTSSILVSPDSTTKYTVIVTDTAGCSQKATVKVSIKPTFTNVCCDSIITNGQQVQLISSGGQYYKWSPSAGLNCDTCPDPVATPTITTTYTVNITKDSGCNATRTVTIEVNAPPCGDIFIPDAFSPNKDGKNDILLVHNPCIKTMNFIIYDRWGNKIFESDNVNNGWDGNYLGQPMNTGTYVYYFKASMNDGSSIEKKGNVALVR
jgi:gliding motility-associated-like protein